MIPYGKDDWWDYRPTEFRCESCTWPLYRVWPSTMLVCTYPTCHDREPLFLVVGDD